MTLRDWLSDAFRLGPVQIKVERDWPYRKGYFHATECSPPPFGQLDDTWRCPECCCPWKISPSGGGLGPRTVSVDPSRPFAGTRQESYQLPTGGPQWRLDLVTYSHEQEISGQVEKELLVLPKVVHATLVWVCNPGIGPMPRLYIQETTREHRREITNKSRQVMRTHLGDEAVRSHWLAFGEVPRTRGGQVNRDYYRRYKVQSRDS